MEDRRFNLFYFAFFFFFLSMCTLLSLLSKEHLGGSKGFFFLYALVQITLETALLLFIAVELKKRVSPFFFKTFIGLSFLLLSFHFFDLLMNRILSLSVWDAFSIFVLDESFSHFLFLLEASGVSLWIWILALIAFALLPFLGVFFYEKTLPFFARKPPRKRVFFQLFFCLPAALFFWDFSMSKVIHPDAYVAFKTSLPFKRTLIEPSSTSLSLHSAIKEPMEEGEILSSIERQKPLAGPLPNIYLFIAESLRKDAICSEITPKLFAFQQNSIGIEKALSSGNGTHLSWFSIFFSEHPLFWKRLQERGFSRGSPALNLLKKWGYRVRLYSSAELRYYGMGQELFGRNYALLDSKKTFPHTPPANAAEADTKALFTLLEDIGKKPHLKHGQVFLIFWDATHFDYSWPKSWTPKFSSFANHFSYLKAFYSQKGVEEMKKSYWNAANYLDALFGFFLTSIQGQSDAIVVFTSDHGEEFCEKGHLFHNSHLSKEQTHIPLFIRLPPSQKTPFHPIASHIDIFPTLIDYIARRSFPFLKGTSLLNPSVGKTALTARFNAGRTPYEFSLRTKTSAATFQFSSKKDIFSRQNLKLIGIEKANVKEKSFPDWAKEEFRPFFSQLFPEADEEAL